MHSFQFLEVPPNQVIEALAKLDDTLTPTRGLRRWTNGAGVAIAKPPAGRLLLLVHGTFSKGEMFFEELAATPDGQAFLATAEQKYDAVLTFDHPTLSMSPWLNALDLSRALDGAAGPIDVICHSRGGLVTAWWLFHARPPVKRVVFAGSPLEGTSLAAPARLKAALDLLGNLARAVGTMSSSAATAVPLLAAAGGLMKILGGMLSFGAGTPARGRGHRRRARPGQPVARREQLRAAAPLRRSVGQAPRVALRVVGLRAAGAGRLVEVLAVLPPDSRAASSTGAPTRSSMGRTISSSTPRP